MKTEYLSLEDAKLSVDQVNATVLEKQEVMRLGNRVAMLSYADMIRFIITQCSKRDEAAIVKYAERNLVSWSGFEK